MDPSKIGAELMKNPEFMEMFQRALGDGQIPDEKDPNRDKWLREMQAKLAEESKKAAKKKLETPVTDAEGTWMWIVPEAGFCIKCGYTNGEGKVFINICQHERIAEPIPLEEEEEEDTIKFRIPLSCGQARAEVDKAGRPCKAYDVIVNPNTIKRCSEDNEFRRFVAALCMSWIKQKSEPNLNADQFTNINIKVKGTPEPQRVRLSEAKKPDNAMQGELNLPENKKGATAPTMKGGSSGRKMVHVIDPKAAPENPKAAGPGEAAAPLPTSNIEPAGVYDWSTHSSAGRSPYFRDTVPERYIVTVKLPSITTIKEVEVTVKSRRIDFTYVDVAEEGGLPFFSVPLPYPVEEQPMHAKFVRATKMLTLHVKVSLPKDNTAGAPCRDAAEEEEEELRRAEEESKKRIDEHRARMERIQKEEEEVMRQRKEWVSNLNAIAEGGLPPSLVEEVNRMPKEQQHTMLIRLEQKALKGDFIDDLLKKLPEEALRLLCIHLRENLNLEVPQALREPKKPPMDASTNANKSTWQKQLETEADTSTVEYNFAKKAQKMFGVEMHNRYLFALDH